MAIQKHLSSYAEQKPVEQQTSSSINELINLIEILQQHRATMSSIPSAVMKVVLNNMANTSLPREAPQIQQIRLNILQISDFFKNLPMSNEEKFRVLETVFSHLIAKREPESLVVLGLLVIPDDMVNQAIECFFKFIKWSGRDIREVIVVAINRLILWQRKISYFQLDFWISRMLLMLNTNGYSEIVDDVASVTIIASFLTLVIPVYQTKMLNVVQALLENSKYTKEVFDKIQERCVTMLTKLEDTNSIIFEPLMDIICETLCTINETDLKYRELVSGTSSFFDCHSH